MARIAPWREFAGLVYASVLALGGRQARRIVVLSDGATWFGALVQEFLTNLSRDGVVHVLDIWHALEHLAQAARLVLGEDTTALRHWLNARRLELRAGRFSAMLLALNALAAERPAHRELRQMIEAKVKYFSARREQMRYDEFLENDWPIGSGLIEGRIQHLVKGRLDLTGMRWDEPKANAVVAKRCEIANRAIYEEPTAHRLAA